MVANMSAWMHTVLAYLDRKGKGSYPQPWWPLPKRLRLFSSRDLRGFCDLPVELVLQIISDIESDLDRLCLALTCRSLLELTNCWPLPPELRELTRALPRWLSVGYCPQNKVCSVRWELLRRLENAHWRRCVGCCKLHPVSEFRKLDLWYPVNRRTCIFGGLVGVVRLCPCVEMTFRDKLRITKELIRRKQEEQQPEGDNEAQHGGENHSRGLLPGFDTVTGQHECIQECYDSWILFKWLKVQRKLNFNLDTDHNLILEAEYKVTVTEMMNPPDGTKPGALLLCPHLQVYQSICSIENINSKSIRAIREPGSRRWLEYVTAYRGSYSCPWCEMTIFGLVEKEYNGRIYPKHYSFKTRRSLGNAIENADNTWYRQTETSTENLYWSEPRLNAIYTRRNVLKYHETSQ